MSQVVVRITVCNPTPIGEALTWLEKSNTDLKPELLSVAEARERLQDYARAQRLVAFGIAALARRIDEATSVARVTGTSVTQAKDTIATSKVLEGSLALKEALKQGEISLDHATGLGVTEHWVVQTPSVRRLPDVRSALESTRRGRRLGRGRRRSGGPAFANVP